MWCRRFLLLAVVFFFSWELVAQDFSSLLPQGPGRDDVLANCGACHSFKLIASQGMSRDRWLKTIRWMQEKQNLWVFPPQTENSILDYLALHFGDKLAQGQFSGGMDDLGVRAVNPLP